MHKLPQFQHDNLQTALAFWLQDVKPDSVNLDKWVDTVNGTKCFGTHLASAGILGMRLNTSSHGSIPALRTSKGMLTGGYVALYLLGDETLFSAVLAGEHAAYMERLKESTAYRVDEVKLYQDSSHYDIVLMRLEKLISGERAVKSLTLTEVLDRQYQDRQRASVMLADIRMGGLATLYRQRAWLERLGDSAERLNDSIDAFSTAVTAFRARHTPDYREYGSCLPDLLMPHSGRAEQVLREAEGTPRRTIHSILYGQRATHAVLDDVET